MPDMTDILTAHHPKMGFLVCRCGWQRSGSIDPAIQHAAHVAAALETAGYGQVAGVTEWGVRYSDSQHVSRHVSQGSAQHAAEGHNAINKSEWHQPFTMEAVSRTVTAWKKEA